jgi:hypothetical protein
MGLALASLRGGPRALLLGAAVSMLESHCDQLLSAAAYSLGTPRKGVPGHRQWEQS